MLLGTLGIGLVLDEALVVEVSERGVKHYEGRGLESLLIAVAEADVLQGVQFLCIAGDHHRKEQFVVLGLLAAVLHLVEKRVFVNLRGIELETVRTSNIGQIPVEVLPGSRTKVDDLCRGLEFGEHQLLLDFLDLLRRKSRELDGVHSTRSTLDDAVIVEPCKDVINLVFDGRTNEQGLDVVLARGHRLVVSNVVEGIQQEDALENSKVGSALVFYAQAVRVEALCNGTELGHVVVEFRNHVIPEVVCSDGLPIHEIILVVEESLDGFILAQELEHTSR